MSQQFSNLLWYQNSTVVCKYRPELNFDNLNKFEKFLSLINFTCVWMGIFREIFKFRSKLRKRCHISAIKCQTLIKHRSRKCRFVLPINFKVSTSSRLNKKCPNLRSVLKWASIVLTWGKRVSSVEMSFHGACLRKSGILSESCFNKFSLFIFNTTAQVKLFANYFCNLFLYEAVLYLVFNLYTLPNLSNAESRIIYCTYIM